MNKEQRLLALQRAILVRGRERLAQQLGVKQRIIELWEAGVARIPQPVLLALIDILMEDGAPVRDGERPGVRAAVR
jgi:DNA-binding transcriptional regulator YiaG